MRCRQWIVDYAILTSELYVIGGKNQPNVRMELEMDVHQLSMGFDSDLEPEQFLDGDFTE